LGTRAQEILGQPGTVFYTEQDIVAGLAGHEMATAAQTGRFETEDGASARTQAISGRR